MRFSPSYALVTGPDSGIGRACAAALAHAGLDVAITWYRDRKGTERTAQEIEAAGRRSVAAYLDTSAAPACGDVIDELVEELGGLDVFVNNAGTADSAPFLDMALEQWRHTMAVDLEGAFVCMQRAARHIVARVHEDRVVAITSVHEHQPRVGWAAS